jgi:hypothetical protein
MRDATRGRAGSPTARRLRTLGLVAAGLAAVVFVTYSRILVSGHTFADRDALVLVRPAREFLATTLRSWRLPEWSDWIGLGAPFAANPNHLATYPPAWIAALLPVSLGSDVVVLLHLVVAGLGMAALARRLGAGDTGAFVAGSAFMLSGYVGSVMVHLIVSVAWMPWVAWAADRNAVGLPPGSNGGWVDRVRLIGPLAGALALQLWGGEPAHVITAGLVAAVVTIARATRPASALARLGVSIAFAVALAAVVVIPALGYLQWSSRSTGVPETVRTAWSMHPLRIVELGWPNFLGDRTQTARDLSRIVADSSNGVMGTTGWALSVYVGLPVLALALAGGFAERGSRRLLLGSGVLLLLALGAYTPVLSAFTAVFPPERVARYPEKHLAGAVLLWCVLAGVGFSRVLEPGVRGRRVIIASGVAGAVLLGCVLAGLLSTGLLERRWRGVSAIHLPPVDVAGAVTLSARGGAIAALGMGLFLAALAIARARAAGAAALAAALTIAPMVYHTRAVTRLAPREIVSRPPRILAPAARQDERGPRPRLYNGGLSFPPLDGGEPLASAVQELAALNTAARYGFAVFPTFDSAMSPAMEKFQSVQGYASLPAFVGLFGIDYLLLDEPFAAALGAPILAKGPYGGFLAAGMGARPRAFVAARWRWDGLDAAVSELAFSESPDLGRVTLVGTGRSSTPGPHDLEPPSACEVVSPRPELVEVRCDSRLGGYAVLLDEPAPGWRASVDGMEAPIERANGLFRAVQIGAGRHTVRFSYETPGLRVGLVVSAVAWSALAAGVIAAVRRERRRRASVPPAGTSAA